MTKIARIVACALGLLLFTGCAGTANDTAKSETAAAMLNSKCVISGEALDASSPTVEYMGGKVGFCCDKCMGKWNGMDDAAKKAAVAAHK